MKAVVTNLEPQVASIGGVYGYILRAPRLKASSKGCYGGCADVWLVSREFMGAYCELQNWTAVSNWYIYICD